MGYDDVDLHNSSNPQYVQQQPSHAQHPDDVREEQMGKEGYKARAEDWQSRGIHWGRLRNVKNALFQQTLILSLIIDYF